MAAFKLKNGLFKLKNGVVKADKFSKPSKPQQGLYKRLKTHSRKTVFHPQNHQFWELCSLVFNYSTCLMKVTSTGTQKWHAKNMKGWNFLDPSKTSKNLPPSQDFSCEKCHFSGFFPKKWWVSPTNPWGKLLLKMMILGGITIHVTSHAFDQLLVLHILGGLLWRHQRSEIPEMGERRKPRKKTWGYGDKQYEKKHIYIYMYHIYISYIYIYIHVTLLLEMSIFNPLTTWNYVYIIPMQPQIPISFWSS